MTDNYTMPNIRAPMTDPKTGLPEKCWYLYLNNLFGSSGNGQLGGTTQVLHGGSAGYSQVSLTADVTGTLPVTKGGTGTVSQFSSGSVVFASANGVYASSVNLTFSGSTLAAPALVAQTLTVSSVTVSTAIISTLTVSTGTITNLTVSTLTFNPNPIVTETNSTHTLATTTRNLICNRPTGTITITFPSLASGHDVTIRTVQNQTVVSNASNIVALDGQSVGTAILAATFGKWAYLVTDGTNWQIQSAN